MFSRSMISLTAVTFLISIGAAQQIQTLDFLKDSKGRELLNQYETSIAQAKEEYEATLRRHTATLVAELEKLLKEETMAGNLDAALQVRDAIRQIKAGGTNEPQPPKKLETSIFGVWRILNHNGVVRTYRVSRGRDAPQFEWLEFVEPNGKRTIVNQIVPFLRKENSYILGQIRIHFHDGRLYFEHWSSSGAVGVGRPEVFGLGVKVED